MNHVASIFLLIGKDVVGFFVFPAWWYTEGLKQCFIFVQKLFFRGINRLGIEVWIRNIFVPMFGQDDWEGRLISFWVRLSQIIVRSIGSIFWALWCAFIFFSWIFIPLIALVGIIDQIFKIFLVKL